MEKRTEDKQREQREAAIKILREKRREWAAQETVGKRFVVPREGQEGVRTILYRPSGETKPQAGKLPVLFNMHGGGWIGGDAVLMESFCQLLAEEIPALVVNINYIKGDVKPVAYAIQEVKDTVKYFYANSEAFGIDRERMAVGGHSAGAHLACCADFALAQEGITLAAQMLVYPAVGLTDNFKLMVELRAILFPDGGWDSPELSPILAQAEQLRKVSPAIFIFCGTDELREGGLAYAKRLMDLAVPVKVKEYPNALHGFLEVNRPDYSGEDDRKTLEQAACARDCERYLIRELRASLI